MRFGPLLPWAQAISKSLCEAAEVDGGSTWQEFVEITLPMLRPAIFVALILRTITAVQTFDIPFAMTGGGPGDATETLAMCIHTHAVGRDTLYPGEFAFPWALIPAALVVAIVPISILIAVFQERVVGGRTSVGVKG